MSGQNKITKERIVEAIISREEMREGYFKECVPQIGKFAALELEQLYSLYDERLYVWLATLWDPQIGGFYFSFSGRDCDAFLPDIESTAQAMGFVTKSGLLSAYGRDLKSAVPEPMKAALLKFSKSLQDKDDGFFYHPQWGKNVVTERRARDLSWATSLIEKLGDKPQYPTPLDKGMNGESSENLPSYLKNVDEWRSYLREFDLAERSAYSGSVISAQAVQIRAAGEEYVRELISWLEENQNPENGLWEKKISYPAVDGMMKMAILYNHFDIPMKNVDKAMKSALISALSDDPISCCTQFYNPIGAISGILENLRLTGAEDDADALRRIVIEHAEKLIKATREKIVTCKRSDGSFSYDSQPRSRLSQKAPVGLGLEEGDINASSICSTGIVYNLCGALGIPRIPIFCEKDSKIFFDIIDNAIQLQKKYEKPKWFDDAVDPKLK
jgi:hypothetical protein